MTHFVMHRKQLIHPLERYYRMARYVLTLLAEEREACAMLCRQAIIDYREQNPELNAYDLPTAEQAIRARNKR